MDDLILVRHQKMISAVENHGRAVAKQALAAVRRIGVGGRIAAIVPDVPASCIAMAAARRILNQHVPVAILSIGVTQNLSSDTRACFISAGKYGAVVSHLTTRQRMDSWLDDIAQNENTVVLMPAGVPTRSGTDDELGKIISNENPNGAFADVLLELRARLPETLDAQRIITIEPDGDFRPSPPSPDDIVFKTEAIAVSRERARLFDSVAMKRYGIDGLALMENAGYGAAREIFFHAESLQDETGARGSVLILAGRGNNGGDGFVVARHLRHWGVPADVWVIGRPNRMTDDARANLLRLETERIPYFHSETLTGTPAITAPDADSIPIRHASLNDALSASDIIVDAMLGTGLSGTVRDPYQDIISAVNTTRGTGTRVIALDTPSGLDCNRGVPLGVSVIADATLTFGAPKYGFTLPNAREYIGELTLIDIGLPAELIAPDEPRQPDTDGAVG